MIDGVSGRLIHLDERLMALAEMIGRRDSMADIGSDHGRLPVFLLQRGLIHRAIICDISSASLEKAKGLVRLCEQESNAEYICADGLSGLQKAVDCITIAGMGGTTIRNILQEGRDRLGGADLFLQPNVAASQVRGAIEKIGYHITDERIIRDSNRLYVIIAAQNGAQSIGFSERIVGPVLMRDRPPLLHELAQFHVRVLTKALRGAEQSCAQNVDKTERMKQELSIWMEMLR